MSKYSIKNVLISTPFFVLGAAFIFGAFWLLISRLLEGLAWHENDPYVIGAVIFLLIFGGAFTQFGLNALNKGCSKNSKRLISPLFYYFIAALLVVPGAWSAIYGSINALIVLAIGIAIAAYGLKQSNNLKSIPQE
jgi:hypothetical protein